MEEYLNKNYLVVGCGGLGCYIIEGLLRLGVKKIVVCDPDKFSLSNMNRQLYSSLETIDEYKVKVAAKRARDLGYKGEFIAHPTLFDISMLNDIDVVFDALDSISDRLKLEDYCADKNLPIIHGAVEGNFYQVGVSLPHSNMLHNIYKDAIDHKEKNTNVITVQMCAAKQLSLITKELKEYFEMEEI